MPYVPSALRPISLMTHQPDVPSAQRMSLQPFALAISSHALAITPIPWPSAPCPGHHSHALAITPIPWPSPHALAIISPMPWPPSHGPSCPMPWPWGSISPCPGHQPHAGYHPHMPYAILQHKKLMKQHASSTDTNQGIMSNGAQLLSPGLLVESNLSQASLIPNVISIPNSLYSTCPASHVIFILCA